MRRGLWTLLLWGLLGGAFVGAQSLSQQVLQLLTRNNSWTGSNTFLNLRLIAGVPSDTALRFYVDNSSNLYFNGVLVASGAGGVTPHNLLSATHTDTVAATVARGAVVVGNSTPKWALLALCTSGYYLGSNGSDTVCGNSASAFTNIPAAQITGTAGAFDGNAITNLNATALGTGSVPLARLTGITFATWASNSCVNGDTAGYNGTAWVCTPNESFLGTVTSVALTAPAIFSVAGSPITAAGTLAVTLATQVKNLVWAGPASGADATPTFRTLVTADFPLTGVAAGTYPKVTVDTSGRVTAASAQITLTTDVTGILPMANGGTGVGVSADDSVLVGSGAAWVAQTLPNCPSPSALGYTQATNLFNCVVTGGPTHSILSATHTDSLAAVVVRGDLIRGNATPAWSRYAIGASGSILASNGVDPAWSLVPAGLTSIGSALYQSPSAKVLFQGTGTGATQLASTQTTPPTCSTNCGTTVPAIVGTDSDMTVTMGSGGAPASGWVVTFNGTWAAAPACVSAMGKAGMVVGKLPLTLVTTTTTLTVVTNGTDPAVNDVYHVLCRGKS